MFQVEKIRWFSCVIFSYIIGQRRQCKGLRRGLSWLIEMAELEMFGNPRNVVEDREKRLGVRREPTVPSRGVNSPIELSAER